MVLMDSTFLFRKMSQKDIALSLHLAATELQRGQRK